MLFLLLIGELILLYFFSRAVTKRLFEFLLLLFRTRPVAVAILLVLEFPGTVVHELSHLFTAEILGVPTGKLSLEPESIRGNDIRAGSVMIAETDPFRRYAIGLAPLFSGVLILTALSYFLTKVPSWGDWVTPGYIILGYLLFAVSNTMFSSPQDLRGFLPFVIVLALFGAAFYYLGLRFTLSGVALTTATNIATTLVRSLGIVLAINTGLLLIAHLLSRMMQRVFHLKIVR